MKLQPFEYKDLQHDHTCNGCFHGVRGDTTFYTSLLNISIEGMSSSASDCLNELIPLFKTPASFPGWFMWMLFVWCCFNWCKSELVMLVNLQGFSGYSV